MEIKKKFHPDPWLRLMDQVRRVMRYHHYAYRTEWFSSHTFRECFSTHMLENGVNILLVQKLMGHADVKTTEISTHVMEKNISTVTSPLDPLEKKQTLALA